MLGIFNICIKKAIKGRELTMKIFGTVCPKALTSESSDLVKECYTDCFVIMVIDNIPQVEYCIP